MLDRCTGTNALKVDGCWVFGEEENRRRRKEMRYGGLGKVEAGAWSRGDFPKSLVTAGTMNGKVPWKDKPSRDPASSLLIANVNKSSMSEFDLEYSEKIDGIL